MLKITSFSALIVGLLLAIPLVFSDAEAGRTGDNTLAVKSDRESTDRLNDNRIADAFKLVETCSAMVTGSIATPCQTQSAQLVDVAGKLAVNTVTVESRDEASHTSTLTAAYVDER